MHSAMVAVLQSLMLSSFIAGKSHIAPLVGEMLQRIQAEVARYERVISYWPSFGPNLEAAVCAALRTTTAAVSRQCGLIPMIGVRPLSMPNNFVCSPFVVVCVSWETLMPMSLQGHQTYSGFALPMLHASHLQCIAQSTQTKGAAALSLSQAIAQFTVMSSLAEQKFETHSTSA